VNFEKVPVAAVPLTVALLKSLRILLCAQKHNKNQYILHAFLLLDGAWG